jgi:hypothetical protein
VGLKAFGRWYEFVEVALRVRETFNVEVGKRQRHLLMSSDHDNAYTAHFTALSYTCDEYGPKGLTSILSLPLAVFFGSTIAQFSTSILSSQIPIKSSYKWYHSSTLNNQSSP